MMRYALIRKEDISNGPGIRVSLFTQGCLFQCKGCFNEETWNPDLGKPFTKQVQDELFEYLSRSYIKGLSILGGEPMLWDESITSLVYDVKQEFPNKTIWMWTGYTWDRLIDMDKNILDGNLLKNIDVVIDGRFILEEADDGLLYRGSRNQRVIDVKKSLESDSIITVVD